MLQPPYPDLDELLLRLGGAGRHLAEIEAAEGAAGNLSLCLRWPVEPRSRFPLQASIELPLPCPELAGATFLVSGSGQRLREILDDPPAHIACLVVEAEGRTGSLYTAPQRRFTALTSEFNSHLAVHHDQVLRTGRNFNAVVHAQPVHLTYLSHIPRYQDEQYLNTHLLRWQPETILNLPQGIGCVPFTVPGSAELMRLSVMSLREHRLAIWARHGAIACSETSIEAACDLLEYAEAAARYEYKNLALDEPSAGLSAAEIRAICQANHIQQSIF